MSHYRSNLRDLEFNLFEVLGAGELHGQRPVRRDGRRDAPASVLHELEKVAAGPIAASFVDCRPQPADLRPGDLQRHPARVVQEVVPCHRRR